MANKKCAKALTIPELEKAKALSALGKSYRQIGIELHRSDKTIKKALTKTPEVIAEIQELRKEVSGLYEDLAQRILESIGDEVIHEAKLRDRVISAGVCTDKARLLKDGPEDKLSFQVQVNIVNNKEDNG